MGIGAYSPALFNPVFVLLLQLSYCYPIIPFHLFRCPQWQNLSADDEDDEIDEDDEGDEDEMDKYPRRCGREWGGVVGLTSGESE